MTDFKIPQPKSIKGQTGSYWRTASGKGCEFYLKFKFESVQAEHGGNSVKVDALQVNVLYFGPQFALPDHFKMLETRVYEVDGKETPGFVVGKIWVPCGDFNKDLAALHQRVQTAVIGPLDAALAPLYAAAGAKVVIELGSLWALLTENQSEGQTVVAPVVLICQQFHDYQKELKTKIKEKFSKKQSTESDDPPL